MIYFTISNDLHYLIASKYAKEILTYGLPVTFIRYRDVRNFRIKEDEGWETIWLDGSPRFHLQRPIFTFYKHFHNFKQLANISFCKKDVLFILTEYELNNLLLAKKARRAKATTVLLDEGLGTFIINNYRISDYEFTYKHYIYQNLFSFFYRDIRLAGGPFRLNEKYYDYFLPTFKIKIKRNMNRIDIRHPLLNLASENNLSSSRILLLTSGIKDFSQKNIYQSILESLIPKLVDRFERVYLKLHPREYTNSYKSEREKAYILADKYKMVLIDENLPAESIIPRYRPKYVLSFLSNALLNCVAFGCQPFFLYSLLPKIKIWEVLDPILRDLNYNFIFSLDQIEPTYESGLKADKLFRFDYTILDFLRDILKGKRELRKYL